MGGTASRKIKERYEVSPLNNEEFEKNGAGELSPAGEMAEFFAAMVNECKRDKFLSGIGLTGGKVDAKIAGGYLNIVAKFAPADAATYYVQKCSTCILIIFYDLAAALSPENPVRARAMSLLSTTAYELAYCADNAVLLSEEAGPMQRKQPHKTKAKANPVTNRGLRTGQATTNAYSLRTNINHYKVEPLFAEGDLNTMLEEMEAKLVRFGWSAPQEDQGPMESTEALSRAIKSLAAKAAEAANAFYNASKTDMPQFVLKKEAITRNRQSTRLEQFEKQAGDERVGAWGRKTMDLLISYQNKVMEVEDANLDPGNFDDIEVEDNSIWLDFMNSEADGYSFIKLIEGHFAMDKHLHAWIDRCDEGSQTFLTKNFPMIFGALRNLDESNSNKIKRWIAFEAQLAAYSLDQAGI